MQVRHLWGYSSQRCGLLHTAVVSALLPALARRACRAGASLCAVSTAKRRRNLIHTDSLLAIGAVLSKQSTMPYNEHHSIQIRAEAFNLTNTAQCDVNQLSSA